MSTEDIAMRQRLPGGSIANPTKRPCIYQIFEGDWKLDEGLAYDNSSSLDIVTKVDNGALVDFKSCNVFTL